MKFKPNNSYKLNFSAPLYLGIDFCVIGRSKDFFDYSFVANRSFQNGMKHLNLLNHSNTIFLIDSRGINDFLFYCKDLNISFNLMDLKVLSYFDKINFNYNEIWNNLND